MISKRSFRSSPDEHKRLLASLTNQFRKETQRLKLFTLPLAGEPAPVSKLYLDHNSLESIPIQALYNATGLYEIYLSSNELVQLPPYAFGFSHRLTRIDLSHNQIELIDNSTFQRHPDAFAGPFLVDYLDLSHNQLTLLESNVFSYLVNLRILKLEHNQIRSISAHVWTGLYRLKYLDLSHNTLENFTQAFYSGYLSELNHLKITTNNLHQLGPCEFVSLKSLNKLNLSKYTDNGRNRFCASVYLRREQSIRSRYVRLSRPPSIDESIIVERSSPLESTGDDRSVYIHRVRSFDNSSGEQSVDMQLFIQLSSAQPSIVGLHGSRVSRRIRLSRAESIEFTCRP